MKLTEIYNSLLLENGPDLERWFNGSEMVSHDGNPIVFYHGSSNDFETFDANKIGSSTDAGWLGWGFYFYTEYDEAAQYGKVKSYHLKIENPYYATVEDNKRLAELDDEKASREFTQELIEDGYDGVYYNGDLRGETVVFNPSQIWRIQDIDEVNKKIVKTLSNQKNLSFVKNELRESNDGLDFNITHLDGYKNQNYWRCSLNDGETRVAYADFSTYGEEEEVHISFIESKVKGKGYGEMIMKHLASIYGYENLERSSLTDDGAKMRQKLDKHFNFDYDKHKQDKAERDNKHLDMSVIDKIPNQMVKDFIKSLTIGNRQQVWGIFMEKDEFDTLNKKMYHELDIDFNDLSDIAEWVKGSKQNDHDIRDDVPDHVLEILDKLYQFK